MTLIETHNITLQELNLMTESERRIFESISSQFLTKQTLTEKQNDLLTKLLKREFDISNIEHTKMFLYRSYFYRPDWRGDYIRDTRYVLSPVELEQEQIIDAISEQYNYKAYTNIKYKGIKMENILNDLWVVTFTCAESINSTTAQGPFESKEVAENFADIWNKKRDEHIDKTIGEDPHDDYEFYYIKAKAIQLELSQSSRKLLEEIETIY